MKPPNPLTRLPPSPSTIFVFNLQSQDQKSWLLNLLSDFGEVISTHLPKNPSKSGKFFGFALFKNPEEATKAITSLNGLRTEHGRLIIARARGSSAAPVVPPAVTQRLSARSFKDEVAGFIASQTDALPECTEKPNFRIFKSLDSIIIATAHSNTSVDLIQRQLEENNLWGISVQYLGSRVFLVSYPSKDALREAEQAGWVNLSQWFFSFHPSTHLLKESGLFKWVSIVGLPPICWSIESLWSAGAIVGDVILIHPSCGFRVSFNRGLVLVHTKLLDAININARISVFGKKFPILIHEINAIGLPFTLPCGPDLPGVMARMPQLRTGKALLLILIWISRRRASSGQFRHRSALLRLAR